MENLENVYNNVIVPKLSEYNEEVEEIVQDISKVNDSIVLDYNLKDKIKIYGEIEEKYLEYLNGLRYFVSIKRIDKKLDKYVESDIKSLNTLLGTLKLFLVRIVCIKVLDNKLTNKILDELYKENNRDKIKDLYINLDKTIFSNISC